MRLHCPHCGGHRQRPEAYRWYESVLALVLLRPFRCLRCGSRFIRFAGVPRYPGLLALK